MSDTTPTQHSYAAPAKPLSVRLTEDQRAQLEVLAQLNDRSVTEEIRIGLLDWIEKSKSSPAVLQRAEAVRAEIEREATTRRNAISAIFDGKAKPAGKPTRGAKDSPEEPAEG